MSDGEPRVLAVVWLPLSRAALCLGDETIFDLAERCCPTCGDTHLVSLAAFLNRTAA